MAREKDRCTQVNGSGIEDLDLRGILGLGGQFGGTPLFHFIVGLFEDDGGALPIGVGQGGTGHLGKTQVIKLAGLPFKAETKSRRLLRALRWPHGPQVRPIGKLPRIAPLPGLGVHRGLENMSRYEL